MELNAILIDDELDCLSVLDIELKRHCPSIHVIDKCSSAKEGLISIKKNKPDLIFLDINMPHITGLEMIEMIPDGDYQVVFTTAFDNYAVKAFKTCAVDYLLKPIKKDELKAAVDSVLHNKVVKFQNNLDFIAKQVDATKKNSLNKIILPSLEGYIFLQIDEIIACESDENYTRIFTQDGEKLFIKKPLKFIEEILCDGDFMRIHKSYIVNLNKIKKYVKVDGGYVIMDNNLKINISRIKKDEFTDYVENY